MILEFLPEASAELFEAVDYYESKQEDLGRRFRNEVLGGLRFDCSAAVPVA